MRRQGIICLVAFALAGGGLAHAQESDDTNKIVEPDSELPSSLDRFVKNAIDEGLLTPAQPSSSPSATSPKISPNPHAPIIEPAGQGRAQAGVSLRPKQSAASNVCAGEDPFDFSEYHELRTYDDLLAWRSTAEAAEPEHFKNELARAYIALGLNEEARLQLNGVVGAEASALRRLAVLMEDRAAPDRDFFRQQADCPGVSGIWYSLALLKTDRKAAARRFDERINEFRRLPFQLRVEIAARAVPALDAAGERLIVDKLMANFDEQDIAASSRLKFNRALINMRNGGDAARDVMRNYLNNPEFRQEAAASLLRHGQTLEKTVQRDVANRMIEKISGIDTTGPVASSLDVMLNDLHEVAGYGLTLQLASMPATQRPEAHDRIVSHFVSLAEDGLSSPDTLDNLEAMDALLAGADMLSERGEKDNLYSDASQLALRLGFQNLAATFASRTSDPEDLVEARASLAFRMADHDALKSFTILYPQNAEISFLAALSAVRSGDEALLSGLEPRLRRDARTVVSLIEMDAASGRWIVPEYIYGTARTLGNETYQARVKRVELLRDQQGPPQPAPEYDVADIGPALQRIRTSLEPDAMEVH